MSPSVLFLGLVFGSLGLGYCVYGRRQRAFVPFVCGLALMVVPYVIGNVLGLLAAGIVLAVLPFVVAT